MNDSILLRRRDLARKLGVSVSQVSKFEREKLLTRIEIPGIRAVCYDAAEAEALAQLWIQQSRVGTL